MSFLKCGSCGNVYANRNRYVGGICGVNGCRGTLVNYRVPSQTAIDLKCRECGNVYSSSVRRNNDVCGANGCRGLLDRFRY